MPQCWWTCGSGCIGVRRPGGGGAERVASMACGLSRSSYTSMVNLALLLDTDGQRHDKELQCLVVFSGWYLLCYRLLWGVLQLALLLIAAVPGATTRHDPHRVL